MILQVSKIDEVIKEIREADYIALDTETISLEDKTLVAFSFAYDDKLYFCPVKMDYFFNIPEGDVMRLLKEICNHKGVIFHHFAFDGLVLHNIGIGLKHAPHDTLIISHLVDENGSHKLKDLAKRYLKYDAIEYKKVCGVGKKQIKFSEVSDKELAVKYAEDDVRHTLELFNLLYSKMCKSENLTRAYDEIERPLLLVVHDMHIQGIPVNKKKLESIKKSCEDKRDYYRSKLDCYMGEVNLHSPKQLKEYFIHAKGCPVLRRSQRTGEPSVNADVLKKYAKKGVKEADWILKHRYYCKILSTFIPALLPKNGDGKIHSHFHQVGTTSGRFSSSDPNFQNLPRVKDDNLGIRSCVKAPIGYKLVGYDYSAIELRLAAHFSNEEKLINTFTRMEDIHQNVANDVGCTRDQAKTLSYSLLYGAGINILAKNMKTNRQEANKYLAHFRVKYPSLALFIGETRQRSVEEGYLTMLYGRERHLPEHYESLSEWDKGGMLRSMVNALIQGSSATMLKKAMIDIHREIQKYDAHIIITCHDELICLVKEEYAEQVGDIMKEYMVKAGSGLQVPIEVEGGIGDTWEDIH